MFHNFSISRGKYLIRRSFQNFDPLRWMKLPYSTVSVNPLINSLGEQQALVESFCLDYSTNKLPMKIINELINETKKEFKDAYKMISVVQGLWLNDYSRNIKAKRILELGTFTGLSSICLGESLKIDSSTKSSSLDTCDIDPKALSIAKKYLEKAGLDKIVSLHHESANSLLDKFILKKLPFDLIFIGMLNGKNAHSHFDANKSDTGIYCQKIIDNLLLSPDGSIIVDNVLFKGDVPLVEKALKDQRKLQHHSTKSKSAFQMYQFCQAAKKDVRIERLILPIFDGIMIIRWSRD